MASKKGKERRRSWFSGTAWALLILSGSLLVYWFMTREPSGIPLKYGELDRVLAAARDNHDVTFRKVRVNHGEVTGEIVTSDSVSDGDTNSTKTQAVNFRTVRVGLENDPDFIRTLREVAGAG